MTEERKIVISSASQMSIIRDVGKVKSMLDDEQFDELLHILEDLDIWAMRNDVKIRFEDK